MTSLLFATTLIVSNPRDMGRIQRLTSVSMDAPTLPTDTVRLGEERSIYSGYGGHGWMEDGEEVFKLLRDSLTFTEVRSMQQKTSPESIVS